MDKKPTILIADDDRGHEALLKKNFRNCGISNPIISFRDGQAILDFLFESSEMNLRFDPKSYLLMLDIRMPKVDGMQVLKKIKQSERFKKMPVIIFTTAEDPRDIEYCYRHGCNYYITKPIDYNRFTETIQRLGAYLKLIKYPIIQ